MRKPFDKILVSAALSVSLMTPLSPFALPLDARTDHTAIEDTCEVAGLPQGLASGLVLVPSAPREEDGGGGGEGGGGGGDDGESEVVTAPSRA